FSSRRRHTRFSRDWSSDVCSSDLFVKTLQDYPCKRLKSLDKRYRTKYHMSMIENMDAIQEIGMPAFLVSQEEKWRCPTCGGTIRSEERRVGKEGRSRRSTEE